MKSKYIVIAVLVLVAAGLVYVTQFAKKSPAPATTTSSPAAAASGPESLREMFSKGISETCTYSTSDANGKTEGTVYVGVGKMRADVQSTADGKTTNSHVIIADNTMYTWMEGEKTGFKMSYDVNASAAPVASSTTTSTESQPVNFDTKTDYHCSPGLVDNAKFELPAGVTFSDLSSMMKAAPSPAAAALGSSDQCKACEQLSGTAKDQCLSYLSCK